MRARLLVAAFGLSLAASAVSVSLDGTWTLSYRNQQAPDAAWTSIPAPVPGDTYAALHAAGVIPDPQLGTNAWAILKWEQCEWTYARRFPGVQAKKGERVQLRFDGVDTRAEYLLNGERLGASENMFTPVRFDVTGKLKAENELVVHIKSPLGRPLLGVLGRSRVGGTDVEGIRKAQHMFGWDIMPRIVTSGLWRSVALDVLPECRFGDVHWFCTRTDPKARTADVKVDCQILAPWKHLHASKLRISLARNGKVAARHEAPVDFYQTRASFTARDVDLWWPRDAGEAALYDGVVEFLDVQGKVLARDERKVGLRTVRLERADWKSEQEPGTFRFLVNGTPVYMHGTDWTPLDACHGRDASHLQRALDMLLDLNCNMIRIWGGGVYEPDALYDFCDRNGICVWQDFMMGNVQPEQNDVFAQAIYDEAKDQVVRLRGHACLAMWCANNEIDRAMAHAWGPWAPDPDGERISREVLPRVLRDFDPFTPYIPSSPWWTPAVVRGEAKLSQDHLWGPRQEYYKGAFWTKATPTFVSETGYHGCPNLASLKRMMTPAGLYPWPDPEKPERFNDEWNCKAVMSYPRQSRQGSDRNALMPKQVRNVFGSVPKDLPLFVEQSQTVQAEALKYWLELSRTRKGRTWGMLWWNLRDGWPVISDGVVDYYFGKKKAYDYLKSVQQPQLVAFVDTPFDGEAAQGVTNRLVAVNDRLYPVKGTVKAVDAETGAVVYEGAVEIPANGTKLLAENLKLAAQGMLRVDYAFEGVPRVNRCLYGRPPFAYDAYVRWRSR